MSMRQYIIEGRSQRSNIYPASVRVRAAAVRPLRGNDSSGLPVPVFMGMVRERATFRELDVSLFARTARWTNSRTRAEHRLSDDLRYQWTQVVEGYAGRCDEAAARAGIEWMRGVTGTTGRRRSSE